MKGRAAIAVTGFVLTSLFFIDLCNFIYRCGCTSLWAGADAHCNIHHQAGTKHCPWCSHGYAGYALFFGAIVAPQIWTALRWKRGPLAAARLAVVLALFPIAGGAVALIAGWYDGYWQ
jgi:hypothetical protein